MPWKEIYYMYLDGRIFLITVGVGVCVSIVYIESICLLLTSYTDSFNQQYQYLHIGHQEEM